MEFVCMRVWVVGVRAGAHGDEHVLVALAEYNVARPVTAAG